MGKQCIQEVDFSLPEHLLSYVDLPGFTKLKLKKPFLDRQLKIFSKENELGLLNRLDNDTAGFLYFAKNNEAYERYKKLQSQGKVHKRYIAQIQGSPKDSAFEITLPVMHHKHKEDRMIVLHTPKDKEKGRSKVHTPSTIVKVLHTDNT
jgi:23S rRNA-/tRNA-specific pseudouridylate synthase